ncbi:MAG: SAM-dependent methyltransferase [Candidatus Heimdallarchaeota archaeon]|nr:SAM-dependent methyltransferase [Candidatus Heimdallarchaeota archaeon]
MAFSSKFGQNLLNDTQNLITNIPMLKTSVLSYYSLLNIDYPDDRIHIDIYMLNLIYFIGRNVLKLKNINVDWLDIQIIESNMIINNEMYYNELEKIIPIEIYSDGSSILKLLNDLFQNLFPKEYITTLGEFFTPKSIIELMIKELDFGNKFFVDPSCGVGNILFVVIESFLKKQIPVPQILNLFSGFDVNIFSVQICRVLLLIKLSSNYKFIEDPKILPIFINDVILNHNSKIYNSSNKFLNQFHIGQKTWNDLGNVNIIIGNPPWIKWSKINVEYKELLKVKWDFLFTQLGWRSLVAAGGVDISALFVYSYVEKLAKNGKMILVLPLSLFKSKSGGQRFRLFIDKNNVNFELIKILDFSQQNLFNKASNATTVALFKYNSTTNYPIPWIKVNNNSIINMVAKPIIDEDGAPLMSNTLDNLLKFDKMAGKSQYRARGGINTGGGNKYFWFNAKITEQSEEIIKLLTTNSSQAIALESKLVYPLIRGKEIKKWQTNRNLEKKILVPYLPEIDSKNAIKEDILQIEFPNCYNYFLSIKTELSTRKEYIRWNRKKIKKDPYYCLFRIGEYTFSKYKVAWPHIKHKESINACVLSDNVICDQKVIILATNSFDEANYLCAILNSDIVNNFLSSYLMLDASSHILEVLNIPKYTPSTTIHKELAELSKQCHLNLHNQTSIKLIEQQISKLVNKLWGL